MLKSQVTVVYLGGFIAGQGGLQDLVIGGFAQREPAFVTPPATHAWLERRIYWSDGTWSREAIECIPPKVHRFDPLKYSHTDPRVRRYILPVTDAVGARIWANAEASVGEWYNFVGLLTVGYFELTGQHQAFDLSERAALFCSEGFTVWCRDGGYVVCPKLRPDQVSPNRLESYLRLACAQAALDKHGDLHVIGVAADGGPIILQRGAA